MASLRWLVLVPLLACHDGSATIPTSATEPARSEKSEAAWASHKDVVGSLHRHILVVGDSEACAVQPHIESLVKDGTLPPDMVHVECKISTGIPYWTAQLPTVLSRYPHPDLVVVFLGTNHWFVDKKQDLPAPKPIIDMIESIGAGCVWVGNVKVRGRSRPVNGFMKEATSPSCSYFDSEAANIPLRDGVHPTFAGGMMWVKLVWATLPEANMSHEHHE